MKPSFLINLKKTAVFLLATSLPLVFGGCEKDPFGTKPENPDTIPTQPNIHKTIYFDVYIELYPADSLEHFIKSGYKIHLQRKFSNQFSTMRPEQLASKGEKIHKIIQQAPNQIYGVPQDTIYVTPEALAAGAASVFINELNNTVLPRTH